VKKLLFILTVLALSSSLVTAWASVGATRGALTYDGVRNPNGCEIGPDDKHPTELRVDCRRAEGPAYIRYRYTKASGYPTAIRDAATVSMDAHIWAGTADIRWMIAAPASPARTARIRVDGYAHILSVSWTQ
jgi:hypothetical protein